MRLDCCTTTLPNGVRFYTEHVPAVSSAALGIWVGTGSREEKASENGAPHYLIVRPIDSQALCSAEIKAWIRENKFELCSFTDALHGTQKYQNHLRAIDSDLCML